MQLDIFNVALGLVGIYFLIFGGRIIFSKEFFEEVQENWHDPKHLLFSEKDSRKYSMVRGIQAVVTGIILVGFSLWTLL